MNGKPSWMDQEEVRAEDLSQKGETSNNAAPKLVKAKPPKAPPRATKGFYVQDIYAETFDDIVYQQKKAKGKTAPELAEEAIKLLAKKYGIDTKNV